MGPAHPPPPFPSPALTPLPQVTGIPVLEPSIMEELFWAMVPHLNTVHPMEEWVVKGREEIVARITEALLPAHEYLTKYEM